MNKVGKIAVIVVLVVAVGIVIILKQEKSSRLITETSARNTANTVQEEKIRNQLSDVEQSETLPKLVDLGADKCIPCKMMAPILEELKKEYAGVFSVEFIDVWKNPDAGKKYGIRIIPTQIFFDASGKELFRHEGFFSKEDIFSKWKEFGVKLPLEVPKFDRLDQLTPDSRPAETVCYMCDGDVHPETRVILKTDKGDVHLCSLHCYFITYSSVLDKRDMDEKVFVTDWSSGQALTTTSAVYLYGIEESGRPTVRAFADRQPALRERQTSGGNISTWQVLKDKELSNRCGFCDRAVYPEDVALVKADGLYTWGCCPMCALGVAARTKKDIEVFQKDALTGQTIHVKTTNGSVGLLEPETAVAWAGKKKGPDGKLLSTGCFKQAFFVNESNLRKWVEQHPTATGKMISISEALAAKMALSREQISNACKIGECSPK
ncbi:hypothetical protein ES703_07686 [subsurface metagenome]